MCVGSAGAGDCHWEAYDCAHIIRILGSKWTTKHPLSSLARLTRIYWASCRNEKEIFLTPTAAKGTERKSNNTLCDHRTALHGRRTFKTSNFLPLPQLVHPFFHFFFSFPSFPATLSLLLLYVNCPLLDIVCIARGTHITAQRTVDGGYFAFLSTEHLCPKPWCQTAKLPIHTRWSQRVLCANVLWSTMGKNANITLWYFDCYCYCFPTYLNVIEKINFNQEEFIL